MSGYLLVIYLFALKLFSLWETIVCLSVGGILFIGRLSVMSTIGSKD